jgi:hypothetical protein
MRLTRRIVRKIRVQVATFCDQWNRNSGEPPEIRLLMKAIELPGCEEFTEDDRVSAVLCVWRTFENEPRRLNISVLASGLKKT